MRVTTYEREIEERGFCIIKTVGISMEPLLHNRYSSVVLKKIQEPLKANDVVLFVRSGKNGAEDNNYVLHRIIKIHKNSYIIRGDNCIENEVVDREQIIGIMTGFFNGDDYVECSSDLQYQKYMKTLGRRYLRRLCRAYAGRAVRKLQRCFCVGTGKK